MQSSPSFKQALRIVIKRNIVRIALLCILVAVWWVVVGLRGASRYSVSPHTRARVTLSRVESPSRLLFEINDLREKKTVDTEVLALSSIGISDSLKQQCQEKISKLIEGQSVWIQSAYLGSDQHTVGRVLVAHPNGNPDDVGLMMIREGCAFYCKKDQSHLSASDQQQYLAAEEQAKSAHAGVWADPGVKPSAECER